MNGVNIHIRPASYDDIRVMVTLLKELSGIETDFRFSRARARAGLRRLIYDPHAVALVAERDNLIVGMCTVQTIISTAEGGCAGLLEDLIVHDTFRGLGIGRELLTAAETWATDHKLGRLQLLVESQNIPALEFYRSHGWDNTSLVCRRKYLTTVH